MNSSLIHAMVTKYGFVQCFGKIIRENWEFRAKAQMGFHPHNWLWKDMKSKAEQTRLQDLREEFNMRGIITSIAQRICFILCHLILDPAMLLLAPFCPSTAQFYIHIGKLSLDFNLCPSCFKLLLYLLSFLL